MAIVAVRIIVDHQSLKVGAASFRLMPKAHWLSPWPVAQDRWGGDRLRMVSAVMMPSLRGQGNTIRPTSRHKPALSIGARCLPSTAGGIVIERKSMACPCCGGAMHVMGKNRLGGWT
ncbi:MAG: hypothetical protein WCF79_24395 [Rhodomicrobium sp.]